MLIIQLLLSSIYGSQSNLPVWPDDFKWSSAGKPEHYDCIHIEEGSDPHTWHDNYFCWRNFKRNPGIRWSSAGKIRHMRCTQIHEASDPHSWHDNYLCERPDSPYKFKWYSYGNHRGSSCMKWHESSDPHTWNDNWLCANLITGRNWMTHLDGSKKLSLYSIPGTHDSAARDHSLEWVNCQTLSISSQLEIGVRFFDMRVAEKNGVLVMMHGPFELGFDFQRDMLNPIYSFLSSNPRECVIMRIQRAGDDDIAKGSFLENIKVRGSGDVSGAFVKHYWRNRWKWLLQKGVPTLEECRGKIFALRYGWTPPSNMNIRKWNNDKSQDKYSLTDQWRRRGIFDKIGKGIGYGLRGMGTGIVKGLGVAADGIHDLFNLKGMDSKSQKRAYIVNFHKNNIQNNFDENKLHINHWSYVAYSRVGVPYPPGVTAKNMRNLNIIQQLAGSNLGICVFDFPTRSQVKQVFCRNYGMMNGGCVE